MNAKQARIPRRRIEPAGSYFFSADNPLSFPAASRTFTDCRKSVSRLPMTRIRSKEIIIDCQMDIAIDDLVAKLEHEDYKPSR